MPDPIILGIDIFIKSVQPSRIKITMNTALARCSDTLTPTDAARRFYADFASKWHQKPRIMLNKLFTKCLIYILRPKIRFNLEHKLSQSRVLQPYH